MKRYKTILVGIDFTAASRHALKEAVRRASLDGASIIAVHVTDEFLAHEMKKALSLDKAGVRADWLARLQRFLDESEVGSVQVKAEARIGNAFSELVEACREHHADLLVMGENGVEHAGDHRIGAITARCVRKAPVDVLVVREDAEAPAKTVIACVDFSENSAKAVQAALHLAAQDHARVDCLYVYQSALAMSLDYGSYAPPFPAAYDEEAVKNWQKELDRFIEPLIRTKGSIEVRTLVMERVNVREAILDHVAATKAGMVVLGTTGKGGLRHLLIGTTAEKIVQHAPCSILAVKPDEIIESAEG